MTKDKISVRIPKEMNARLTEHLKKKGLTKNAFIISLLIAELEKAKEE